MTLSLSPLSSILHPPTHAHRSVKTGCAASRSLSLTGNGSHLWLLEGSLLIRVPIQPFHQRDTRLMNSLTSGLTRTPFPSFPPLALTCSSSWRSVSLIRKCWGKTRKRHFTCRAGRQGGSVTMTAVRRCNRWSGTCRAKVPLTRPSLAASRANKLPGRNNGVLIGH